MEQSDSSSKERGERNRVLYSMVSQHWSHSSELRWTLLYNFLVATTILLLAWAAIFSSTTQLHGKRLALIALCIAGFVLSLIWISLLLRANNFVQMFVHLGLDVEESLGLADTGPFHRGQSHRESMKGIPGLTATRYVTTTVPAIFALLYLTLLILSWRYV